MNDKLVSVIIPVYNVENYLKQCVESVINQTYKKIEILLVDDGSTDNSGSICEQYKNKDPRIKVIHKKNGGLSDARNTALDIASGDYVYFLDSDDYINLETFENSVELGIKYNADIVCSSLCGFYGDFAKNTSNNNDFECEVYNRIEALEHMFMDNNISHAACGKLYKKELFSEIRFPVGLLYEDYATTYYVLDKAQQVVYYNAQNYYYRQRIGSIMNSKVTEKDMVLLDIADKVYNDFENKYPNLHKYLLRKKIVVNLKLLSRILNVSMNYLLNYQEIIINNINKDKEEFLNSGLASKADIIKIKAFNKGRFIFHIIYKISDTLSYIKTNRQ